MTGEDQEFRQVSLRHLAMTSVDLSGRQLGIPVWSPRESLWVRMEMREWMVCEALGLDEITTIGSFMGEKRSKDRLGALQMPRVLGDVEEITATKL